MANCGWQLVAALTLLCGLGHNDAHAESTDPTGHLPLPTESDPNASRSLDWSESLCITTSVGLTLHEHSTAAYSYAALVWMSNVTLPSINRAIRILHEFGPHYAVLHVVISVSTPWQSAFAAPFVAEAIATLPRGSSVTVINQRTNKQTVSTVGGSSNIVDAPECTTAIFFAHTRVDADDVINPMMFTAIIRAWRRIQDKGRLGGLVAFSNCLDYRFVIAPGHCTLLPPRPVPRTYFATLNGCSLGQTILLRRDVLSKLGNTFVGVFHDTADTETPLLIRLTTAGPHHTLLELLRRRVADIVFKNHTWAPSLPTRCTSNTTSSGLTTEYVGLDAADEATSGIMLFDMETDGGVTPPGLYMLQPLSGSFWGMSAGSTQAHSGNVIPNGCGPEQRALIQKTLFNFPLAHIVQAIDLYAEVLNLSSTDACVSNAWMQLKHRSFCLESAPKSAAQAAAELAAWIK